LKGGPNADMSDNLSQPDQRFCDSLYPDGCAAPGCREGVSKDGVTGFPRRFWVNDVNGGSG
jgi:hypothetical protein